jgi:hypothetical protein
MLEAEEINNMRHYGEHVNELLDGKGIQNVAESQRIRKCRTELRHPL